MKKRNSVFLILSTIFVICSIFSSCEASPTDKTPNLTGIINPTFSNERSFEVDLVDQGKTYKIYRYSEDGYRILNDSLSQEAKKTDQNSFELQPTMEFSYVGESCAEFNAVLGLNASADTVETVRKHTNGMKNTADIDVPVRSGKWIIDTDHPSGSYVVGLLHAYERYCVEIWENGVLTATEDVAIPVGDAYLALLYRAEGEKAYRKAE